MHIAPKLLELGERLKALGYRFTTVTPFAQRLVNARPEAALARSVRDVFGWNRPFRADILPPGIFDLMAAAGACERTTAPDTWLATVRFSTLGDLLFVHSRFPTDEDRSVFFGPDSVRFAAAIKQHAPKAKSVVDVGAGAGVGGIVFGLEGTAAVVLADVNTDALAFARINAALAGVRVETVRSDVLDGVDGDFDLVISNPPFMRDRKGRTYRDGGGSHGEGLAGRIVEQAVTRLGRNATGGSLLLYTGAAIVDGEDTLFTSLRPILERAGQRQFSYHELDPDIFSDELAQPEYAKVERIAAVLLTLNVAPRT